MSDYDILSGFENVGAFDTVGDLSTEEVGALRRRRQALALQRAAATGKPQTGEGGDLVATNQRRDYLGFSTTPTLGNTAASTATLSATPQEPAQYDRLVLTVADSVNGADQGYSAVLTSLLVGKIPVFSASGSFPLKGFDPLAEGVRLMLPPCPPGVTIVAVVTRIAATTNAGVVAGGFIGAVSF